VYLQAQRWGGGFKADALPARCLLDEPLALAACGDFCGGGRSDAQAAVLSGLAAGRALADLLAK
jgi:predicted NAD/FAD-dependent oxidoreductase